MPVPASQLLNQESHGGILPDSWIRHQATTEGMIEPFVERQVRQDVISYGVSSYGYDARVADEFKIFTNVDNAVVDPKNFGSTCFVDRQTDVCIIPPNSFVLARTVEYFRIPRDVLVICLGKSTYARCGIIVNVTPLEPEWEGHVTLEIIRREGKASTSFIQRHLQIGYNRAARIIEQMEKEGLVSPANHVGKREILM